MTGCVEHAQETDLGEALDFMSLLWSVDHALKCNSKRMDQRLGITGPQRLAIRVIGKCPGISACGLARTLRIHPSTVCGIVKRLERRSIVRRVSDPSDRRRFFLHLNNSGEALNITRSGTFEEAVEHALGQLKAADVSAAKHVLEILITELEAGLPADNAASNKRRSSTKSTHV